MCPGLKHVVWLTNAGIDETAHHASKRVESTLLALNLVAIIESAVSVYEEHTPKPKGRQNKMKFESVLEFHVPTQYLGTAKLMIGKRSGKGKGGYYIHYCCTALRDT